MPLISVSDELAKKSFTSVENKFITKYLPVLEPMAVKVYLYSLYIYQNGLSAYTLEDMAAALSLSEDEIKSYFEYLEELELVNVTSLIPFEIKVLDPENVYGTPKKFKPEKYSDFSKAVQNIIKGRMISTNEFREYFLLLEEYNFEQNALIMIINYCVNLKGDNIRLQYIKKVAKSFADDGVTTAKKVEEKLSAYTSSTPSLIRIFTSSGIKKQPDIDDDKLFKKWVDELGFEETAVIATAKLFKVKTVEKLDSTLTELYKNKKFDVKEIEDYCNSKTSVYNATLDIARTIGVYMQNPAPYVENYVNIWYDYGYSFDCMKNIASYCFKHNKKSFEDMHELVKKLYGEGLITEGCVEDYFNNIAQEETLLKKLLSLCGLTRRVLEWDKENLARWRSWNFSDEMLEESAKLSAGKSNPVAYMNGILSAWKAQGIYSPEKIVVNSPAAANNNQQNTSLNKAEIERHFYDLRHSAEIAAEKQLNIALADEAYNKIHKRINELSIDYALASIKNQEQAEKLSQQIKQLELDGDVRLNELGIDKRKFTPDYSCKKCNDSGYDKNGSPCECMKKFISSLK